MPPLGFAIVLLILGNAEPVHAQQVFERSDGLYRPKKGGPLGILFGHAAIYVNSGSTYRFLQEDAVSAAQGTKALPDLSNSDGLHSVIQAPGYFEGGVQLVSFSTFLGDKPFWGAREDPRMTAPIRYAITLQAGQKLTAGYTFFGGWKGDGRIFKGNFRCDGLVSYAYANAGVPIPENTLAAWITNLPRTQRDKLTLALVRSPSCRPVIDVPTGAGASLSVTSVRDDFTWGSGIDRVEFYNGLPPTTPSSGPNLIDVDDHDSNPDAGLTAPDTYTISSKTDPGANVYTRIFDQAGNFSICDFAGNQVGTSSLIQGTPNVIEDIVAPTINNIAIKQDASDTATATWTATDDQTPADQINYAYAIDTPLDQWDDPNVTLLGAQGSATIDISNLSQRQHTFYLVAFDSEGNIGSASQPFSVQKSTETLLALQDVLTAAVASNGLPGTEVGNTDPLNGITDGSNMVIVARELLLGTTTPVNSISGLAIYLGNPDNGGTLIGSNFESFGAEKRYSSADTGLGVLKQLPAGIVTIVGYDVDYDTVSLTLTVDTGAFTVSDTADNLIAPNSLSHATDIRVDVPAGTAQATLEGPTGFDPVTFFPGESISYFAEFDGVSDGLYVASALNAEGVVIASQTFTILNTPLKISLINTYAGQSPIYDNLAGSPTFPPGQIPTLALSPALVSAIQSGYPMALNFSAQSASGTIQSVTVSGAGSPPVIFQSTDGTKSPVPPPGAGGVSGLFSPTAAGSYLLTVTDSLSHVIQAPFALGIMSTAYVSSGSFVTLTPTLNNGVVNIGSVSGNIQTEIKASQGLARATRLDPTTGLVSETRPLTGTDQLVTWSITNADFTHGAVPIRTSDGLGNTDVYTFSLGAPWFQMASSLSPVLSGVQIENGMIYPMGDDGTFTTDTMQFLDSGLLPGGFIAPAQIPFPEPRVISSSATGQIAFSTVTLGHLTITANSDMGSGKIYDSDVYLSSTNILTYAKPQPTLDVVNVGRSWSATLEISQPANKLIPVQFCRQVDPANPSNCLAGSTMGLEATFQVTATGLKPNEFDSQVSGSLFAAGQTVPTAPLGMGVTALNLSVPAAPSTGGSVTVAVGASHLGTGLQSVPAGMTYDIVSSGVNFPLVVSIPFSSTTLSASQLSQLQLVAFEPSTDKPFPVNFTLGASNAVVTLSAGTGRLAVVTTQMSDPVVATTGTLSFTYSASNSPRINVAKADPNSPLVQSLLLGAQALNRIAISDIYEITPENTSFSPPAILQISYSPAQLTALAATNPQLMQLSSGLPPSVLTNQYSNYLSPAISAPVSMVHSYFAVFGSSAVAPPADRTAPVTSIVFSPQATSNGSAISITTATSIGFAAVDPAVAGTPISGVATTYFLVDTLFVSLSSTPASVFSSTFSLAAGTHTITYFSVDRVGNQELAHSTSVVVAQPVFNTVAPSTFAPTNVSVSAVSDLAAQLGWATNGNNSAVTYIVTWGTATCTSPFNLTNSLRSSATQALVTGLLPSTTYAFSVCNASGGCANPAFAYTLPPGASFVSPAPAACTAPSTSTQPVSGIASLSGLAVAADAGGRLWEVFQSTTGAIVLGRYNSSLAREASVRLPGAIFGNGGGLWTIRFDNSGDVYAVGAASNPATGGDLAVYKTSPDAILLSSRTFVAGIGTKSQAFDASGNLWITGILQTGSFDNGTANIKMGLWKYSLASDLLQLTTTFTRGGPLDGGFGVRVMGDQVFVLGYTSTVPLTTPSVNLALWAFDSFGHGPVAGPFQRRGYLTNLSGQIGARLEVSSNTLFAFGTRTSKTGTQNGLGMTRFEANGTVMMDQFFVDGAGTSYVPQGVTFDASGNVAVAVQAKLTSGPTHGVAKYGHDGTFKSFTLDSNISTATVYGIASLGSDLYLALDGTSVPQKFIPGSVPPGSDVIISSISVDAIAPATLLLASGVEVGDGSVVPVASSFSLSARDPPDGNGFASGVAETLYLVDVDPSSCNADYDPTQPPGTCANPVYSKPFTLSPGAHTVLFNSVDFAGNQEDGNVATFMVVSDTVPPVTTATLAPAPWTAPDGSLFGAPGTAVTFAATDPGPSASGVASTQVSLDSAPFTAVSGALVLGTGPHFIQYRSQDNVGNVEATKYLSMTVRFPVTPAPSLSLSPAGPFVTVAAPVISAAYAAAPGAAIASERLFLDQVDVTARAAVTASSATLLPGVLAQGPHTVSSIITDNFGTVASATVTFTLDSLPPVTTVLKSGVAVSSGAAVFALTLDTFTIAASDSGTGVARTMYSLDGGAQNFYTFGFSLAAGTHTLAVQSLDVAGNAETLQLFALYVRPPLPAPTLAFLAPAGSNFSSELKPGVVIVTGTVTGPGLTGWKLEAAAGQNAPFGFSQVSSGTASVFAAALGAWNAAALSGWQTLRLSAANSDGVAASLSESVYLGDPSLLLALKDLKLPQGVAVGQNGFIYVADTDNDRVQVYTPQGALSASFGAGADSKPPLQLKDPQGVAVDAFGNIYVADTGARRVLKLTSLGQPVLTIPMQGKPVGVAVDSGTFIYVSDNENAQVLKFNQAGGRVLTFSLTGGKAAGVALDGLGRLYVADIKQKRIAVFSSTGGAVGFVGAGALERPYGVAVDTAATTVAVSDMARDRFVRFDSAGELGFSFGGPGSGLGAPRGLAYDAQGFLYMAEKTKNRVIKIGPPAPGVAPVPIADKLALLGEDNAFVTAAVGGKLKRPDLAGLVVPPGALADDLDLTISTPAVRLKQEEELKSRKMDAAGLISVSTGVAFGPDGTSFRAPVYVAVPYDPAMVAALGVPDLSLKLYWWSPDKQDWIWAPCRVDPQTHVVYGRAMRLAQFKVFARKDGR